MKSKSFLIIVALLLLIGCWLFLSFMLFASKDVKNVRDGALPSYDASNKKEYMDNIPFIQYRSHDKFSETEYPQYTNLGDLLKQWSPYDTSPQGWKNSLFHPNKNNGIRRFNFSDQQERALAQSYRIRELPFIIFDIDMLDKASNGPFSLPMLLETFGNSLKRAERSSDNHFMYYSMKKTAQAAKTYPDWKPPQEDILLSFPDFIQEAKIIEQKNDNSALSHLYLTISAGEGLRTPWIRKALPFFSPGDPFFSVDSSEFLGINCRFGMKGVIAAPHYDGKRNFIAMVRGRKRYVLLPPSECSRLDLYPRGHPSARHASLNWADAEKVGENSKLYHAQATEVVVSMGEILYLPSYWFHYIISQDASIQCNARSGDSLIGRNHITACGLYKDESSKSNLRGFNKRHEDGD